MNNKKSINPRLKSILIFAISFLSFGILLFGMLFISIIMDRDTVQADTPISNVPIKNDAYYTNIRADIRNILLTVENENGLSHMAVISLQPKQSRTVIMPIPYNVTVNSNGISAANLYSQGGIMPLCDAISNLTGIDIVHYLSCTDEQFGQLINAYGSLTLEIEQDIDFYYNDIPIKLNKGKHILDGNSLSLLIYNKWGNSSFSSEQLMGQLLCSLFDKICNNGYIADEDKFNNAINFASTDISYLNYLEHIQNYETQDYINYQTDLIDMTTYIDPYGKTIKKNEQYSIILLQYFFIK